MSKYKEIDISKVKATSIKNRESKVDMKHLILPVEAGCSFQEFWKNLPSQLAAEDLKEVVGAIFKAVQNKKPVIAMMGAHVIKVGLSPVIIDLMEKGVLSGIVFNGACAIHDMEMAYFGKTSEYVQHSIKNGSFGMAEETAELLNQTIHDECKSDMGFGEALGKRIQEENPPYAHVSILGQAYKLGLPVTVHVALGTDIVHQHPSADGAAIGEMSLRDFRILCEHISQIGDGGVVLLFGSAVVLPEVFLKALTVARNINGEITGFTTACFDMIRHYRPQVNVLERPNQTDGKGFHFTGHHEIMIPLLAAAIVEGLKSGKV